MGGNGFVWVLKMELPERLVKPLYFIEGELVKSPQVTVHGWKFENQSVDYWYSRWCKAATGKDQVMTTQDKAEIWTEFTIFCYESKRELSAWQNISLRVLMWGASFLGVSVVTCFMLKSLFYSDIEQGLNDFSDDCVFYTCGMRCFLKSVSVF